MDERLITLFNNMGTDGLMRCAIDYKCKAEYFLWCIVYTQKNVQNEDEKQELIKEFYKNYLEHIEGLEFIKNIIENRKEKEETIKEITLMCEEVRKQA